MIFQNMIYLLQLLYGDYLFVYDVAQDLNRAKIAELDLSFNDIFYKNYFFNDMKKTFSSTGNHSLLIHFSTDDINVWRGFSTLIHYFPSNANCADFLDKTELTLTQPIDCSWIITAPSVTGTITIELHDLEVSL